MNYHDYNKDPRGDGAVSQLGQDRFVLSTLNYKTEGYFVEFGATNGYNISNTWLLEKHFGWTGIVAEPSKFWHTDLHQNRSCAIETNCVWSKTGETLVFNEVNAETAHYGPELSTIDTFTLSDNHGGTRQTGVKYNVETISLEDLLVKYNAPSDIDYLSIDTEGSEFEILSNFNFDKYRIKIITCEHNYTPMREQLHELLTSKGYIQYHRDLSQWDDWYINPAYL